MSVDHLHRSTPADEFISSIQGEVLPRLLRAHGDEAAAQPNGFVVTQTMVSDLVELVLQGSVQEVSTALRDTFRAGADLTSICLGLLSPAAARLGAMGEEGLIGFDEVARAIATLQAVLRRLDHETLPQVSRGWKTGSALLAACPGDLHTFGLYMVEEFFVRDGWSVTILPSPTLRSLVDEVNSAFHHVIGLSVVNQPLHLDLGNLIQTMRKASLNEQIRIIVGGSGIASVDEAVALGADGLGVDPANTVLLARHWLDSDGTKR